MPNNLKYALGALGMFLAWDLLKPRRHARSRRLRVRAFHTCRPDGVWREFAGHREFQEFCRQQKESEIYNRGKGTGLQEAFEVCQNRLYMLTSQAPPKELCIQQSEVRAYNWGVQRAAEVICEVRRSAPKGDKD